MCEFNELISGKYFEHLMRSKQEVLAKNNKKCILNKIFPGNFKKQINIQVGFFFRNPYICSWKKLLILQNKK